MAKKKKNKIKQVSAQRAPSVASQAKNVKSVTARAEQFSGPIPPPQILNQYNQIVPGAADRIIAMAEGQAEHRQQLEKQAIDSDIKNSRLGLQYGLAIGLAAVIGATVCIVSGFEIGGSILGGTGLTGLVGVFVYGSRQQRKEREKRLEKLFNKKQ